MRTPQSAEQTKWALRLLERAGLQNSTTDMVDVCVVMPPARWHNSREPCNLDVNCVSIGANARNPQI